MHLVVHTSSLRLTEMVICEEHSFEIKDSEIFKAGLKSYWQTCRAVVCVHKNKLNSQDNGEANLRHRGKAEFQVPFTQPYL